MCKPASGVSTKDRVFTSRVTDSHSEIIREFWLVESVVGVPTVLRWEITPPDNNWMAPLDQWVYHTDQDIMPEWFNAPEDERRARAQFVSVWAKERMVRDGDNRNVVDGDSVFVCGGTVQAVCGGTVRAVYGGTVQAVCGGTVQAVCGGTVRAVYGGTVQAVCGGTVQAVCGGTVQAVHGGTVQAVCGGTVQAVYGGTVREVCGGTVQAVRGGTVQAVYGGTVQAVHGGTVQAVRGGTVQVYCRFSCKLSGLFSVVIRRTGKRAVTYIGTKTERKLFW